MYFSYNNPMRDTSDNLLYMFAELEIFAVAFCALLLKSDLTTTENYDPDTFDGIMILTLLLPNVLFFSYVIISVYINFFGDAVLGYEHTRRLYPVAADSVGLCSYVVFERENLNDPKYHENANCITYLYHKKISPKATLKCTLKYYENSDINARTQVRLLRRG
jgi:hypothetical protein